MEEKVVGKSWAGRDLTSTALQKTAAAPAVGSGSISQLSGAWQAGATWGTRVQLLSFTLSPIGCKHLKESNTHAL